MIARSFENVRLAVQQKSFVRIKRKRADAELGFLLVNNFFVNQNRRDQLVKFWVFGRPENWRSDVKLGVSFAAFTQQVR